MHAKTCKLKHDKCRKTETYKYSGQNVGWNKGFKNVSQALIETIGMWFEEYKNFKKDAGEVISKFDYE